MKTYPVKKVKHILQKLGLQPQRGNGTGHEVWGNTAGKACKPVFRHKDISQASLYALGDQLQSIGLCSRQAFMSEVRMG